MKYIYRIINLLLIIVVLSSCEKTKLGDVDLDFDININAEQTSSYIGKPVKIGVDVDILDSENNYPFETRVKSPSGILKHGSEIFNSDAILDYDFRTKGTFYFEYTPTQEGKETITITIKNELLTRTISCDIECKDALYNVEIKDAPDKPLIDTKFDFNLIVNEMEATGADSIVVYAKVLKGEGSVFSGEQIINNPLTGDESEKNTTAANNKTQLAIGKNNISYISKIEGDNIIRFYFRNKWGIETYQDITTKIHLPEWELKNSEGKETVTIPYQDNYSFTLNITENDIFKDNSYEGFL
jgi:hypothetical protein